MRISDWSSDVCSSDLIGGLDYLGFNGVGQEPNAGLAPTIPHVAFAAFQLFFAAITPALVTGAFAERMKFRAFEIFTAFRPAERRVGKACVSPCRSRWSPKHQKQKTTADTLPQT